MLAAVRPDSWNLPLFLHVLGAMLLFGTTAASAALATAGMRSQGDFLGRATLRTLLIGVLPAWLLMRLGAGWIEPKEDIQGDPGWLGVGFIVAEPGLLLLLVATVIAYLGVRRERGWALRAVAILCTIYLVALGVAWWAMSAKP
jgi:hypothetical protein